MKFLERNKQIVYYAKYSGKTEKTKTVGTGQDAKTIKQGEYDIRYTTPMEAFVYVSVPKSTRSSGFGRARLEADGNVSHYQRVLISEVDLGLTIDDVFWVGIPTKDANDNAVQPNYRIESAGESFHHVTYIIRQI